MELTATLYPIPICKYLDQRQRRLADSVFDIESQKIAVHDEEEEDPIAKPLSGNFRMLVF